jgi:hypothetical protein
MKKLLFHTAVAILCAASAQSAFAESFREDIAFLERHTNLIVLSDDAGQTKVAVAPAWQGRVMTSTNGGDAGSSFGWLNHELIESGKLQRHINAFGGEDRFWLGPEGGQFSLFFAKGDKFDLEHWQTPAQIDTMPYQVISQAPDCVKCAATFTLENYSGTCFELKIEREVRLLAADAAWKRLGMESVKGVRIVAFASGNTITNTGKETWRQDTGLLSVWILGMFKHSPTTTIVVPIKSGSESNLGARVTSDYFGNVPPDRLNAKDNVVYFKGDGAFRSKIGISPKRSKGVMGSYDAENKVLTIVQFTHPEGVTDYVNSQWKIQDNPYGGDAANSYNDGLPPSGAKQLGPFYEMESSSPAGMLAPSQSLTHEHCTMHLSGSETALNAVAQATLGVSLAEIQSALK